MALRKTHSTHLPLPGRQWVSRVSMLLMIVFSVGLIAMSKTGNPAVTRLRTSITDVVAPILSVAASPMDALNHAGAWVVEMGRLREENAKLRNENLQLLKWQSAAKEMESENESLHSLLNVIPSQKNSYVTVRVVSDIGGPYVHSALINGGSENGIQKDHSAVTNDGLMGRVVDVGKTSARVLLLGDINSRVPVLAENAHEKSILVGNNTDLPTLSYLSAGSRIKVGERLVTSGDGGIFPEGIPVGVVTSVDGNVVKVQPYVDATRVEYVSVVDYSF